MATPILRNVQKFGGCSTTCQTGLLESVAPKMEAFVCQERTRLHPWKTHTMPSAHFPWVVFPYSVFVTFTFPTISSETGADEKKVNFFIVCLPTTVWAKLMIQHYFQHLLPCFIPRLDTTSTRYSEIQSKLFSAYVSRNNSHSTIMKFGLAQIL